MEGRGAASARTGLIRRADFATGARPHDRRAAGELSLMPSGLAALLDDVAVIAKLAAASIDDIGAAAGRAGFKAAGVVVDDTAVTPRYVTGFTPDRELPIIWRIAKGSIRNKLLVILPAILLLSWLLPWAIMPILMLGAAYLCFEGAEKVWEAIGHEDKSTAEAVAEIASPEHEQAMVSGAVRTDFILSAEIMVIALNEVADMAFGIRAAILVVVAIAITIGVYGVVGLIVKMDDVGLHMAQRRNGGARAIGRGLVLGMPKLLRFLSIVGIAAMIWVGGGIIVHGLAAFHFEAPEHIIHDAAVASAHAVPFAHGFVEWLVTAAGSGVVGLLLGAVIVAVHHAVMHKKH
jgi:predicted DNA repair protein MutK